MSKSYNWDQIRQQVRTFRAQIHASFPAQALAVIKDFAIDASSSTLYFLANNITDDGSLSRHLALYKVDFAGFLSDNDILSAKDTSVNGKLHKGNEGNLNKLSTLPVLTWSKAFLGDMASNPSNDSPMLSEVSMPPQGVTYYEYSSGRMLIVFGNDNRMYVRDNGMMPVLVPQPSEVQSTLQVPSYLSNSPTSLSTCALDHTSSKTTYTKGSDVADRCMRADPKLGGYHNELVAFIRNRDIWVCNLDGCELQLTFCAQDPSKPAISCGVAEYMMQEEFHRFTSYYWEPVTESEVNRILYLETSEEEVDLVAPADTEVNSVADKTPPEAIRYPRAGRPNAKSSVRLVEFKPSFGDDNSSIVHKRIWDPALRKSFPWIEYIVRFGWLPDNQSVWLQLLSRDQTRMVVLRISCTQFRTFEEFQRMQQQGDTPSLEFDILWQEETDIWINIADAYHFLNSTSVGRTEFIWSSEKSGFRHLYLVIQDHLTGTSTVRQLTEGDWCVTDKSIQVDEGRQLVFFTAKHPSDLETHLYVVRYNERSTPVLLTTPGFSHTITMNLELGVFVDQFSSLSQPPVLALRKLNYSSHGALPTVSDDNTVLLASIFDKEDENEFEDTGTSYGSQDSHITVSPTSPPASEYKFKSNDVWLCPPDSVTDVTQNKQSIPRGELFTFPANDGTRLHGCLYKPRNYAAGNSYPTILYIYGGPKTQLVTNDFKFARLLRYLMSTYFGFAVVIMDGRGSCDRGLKFESYIKHKLGMIELKDQIAGLQYLANSKFGAQATEDGMLHSVIDLDRVAVTGWSYGGYLSLMGLAQYPDLFKIAITGAPVTRWELYDAAYTERYMGLPSEYADNYARSSVLHWIGQFPDTDHRLLIAHGYIDENVHFRNTEELVAELLKHKKPHYLQVYPTEKHGLRHASVNEHFETLMFYWLVNHL
ncbi:uncharacterized protein BYT42DRAFT_609376 [Radiomyces spectabilis]|uniref:uncharacterized protein n=1 Tax=Radiomyces spectabilis TaxID=64574 RepID=UPI002220B539|nr:uncharacterized protein BYT42DRAFT_609376 [Radiomyces spectabilis]KAI8393595.1 hypothetical protein BYT42DRAFT_609376 [Radiomyces spectabilis]